MIWDKGNSNFLSVHSINTSLPRAFKWSTLFILQNNPVRRNYPFIIPNQEEAEDQRDLVLFLRLQS